MESHYDNFRAAKSRSTDFYNTQIKSHSSGRAKDLTKLKDLVDGKNPLSKAVDKCKIEYKKFRGLEVQKDFSLNQNDFDEINRAQEHLFVDKGSTFIAQFKAFQGLVHKKGAEFAKIKQELDSFIPELTPVSPPPQLSSMARADKAISNQFHHLNDALKDVSKGLSRNRVEERPVGKEAKPIEASSKSAGTERAKRMKVGVEKLKVGHSIIISGETRNFVGQNKAPADGHGMLMRITKKEDGSYKMEFANTGLGIHNSKFHPQSTSEPHKFQTIAVIDSISEERLLDSGFFETYAAIALG